MCCCEGLDAIIKLLSCVLLVTPQPFGCSDLLCCRSVDIYDINLACNYCTRL